MREWGGKNKSLVKTRLFPQPLRPSPLHHHRHLAVCSRFNFSLCFERRGCKQSSLYKQKSRHYSSFLTSVFIFFQGKKLWIAIIKNALHWLTEKNPTRSTPKRWAWTKWKESLAPVSLVATVSYFELKLCCNRSISFGQDALHHNSNYKIIVIY